MGRDRSLPLDKLKVDQSFVLRIDVVGEGIESIQMLRYPYEHGCHQAQGFWFSKPLPAPEFVQ